MQLRELYQGPFVARIGAKALPLWDQESGAEQSTRAALLQELKQAQVFQRTRLTHRPCEGHRRHPPRDVLPSP